MLVTIILFCNPVKSQTDCKIITSLDDYNYMNPALIKNNSYVYNNFNFYLYTNEDNTTYSILANNTLIASGNIENNFGKLITWKANTEKIYLLSIKINNNYYNYTNIRVFSRSIMNETLNTPDKDEISFSKVEFNNYIIQLKIRLFSADNLGWIIGFIGGYIITRETKKYIIVEV